MMFINHKLFFTIFSLVLFLSGGTLQASCIDYREGAGDPEWLFDVDTHDLDAVGDIVYAATKYGLQVIDFSGEVPILINSLSIDGALEAENMRIKIYNRYAFISVDKYPVKSKAKADGAELWIVDVANPYDMKVVYNKLIYSGNYNVWDLDVSDRWLWIMGDLQIFVYDVSTPYKPKQVARLGSYYHNPNQTSTQEIVILNGYVYVAIDHYSEFFSDETYPAIYTYKLDPFENPYDKRTKEIEPIDVYVFTDVGDGNHYNHSLSVMNGRYLVTSVGGLWFYKHGIFVLDASDPENLIELGSLVEPGPDYNSDMIVSIGDFFYAYYTQYDNTMISVYDATDPSSIQVIGTYSDTIMGGHGQLATSKWVVFGTPWAVYYQEPHCDPVTPVDIDEIQANVEFLPDTASNAGWSFTWYTESWTDQAFDSVYVIDGYDSPYECQVSLFAPTGTDLDVTTSVEYEHENDRYKHFFTVEIDECIPNCVYAWNARSTRASSTVALLPNIPEPSLWETFIVKDCPPVNPSSIDLDND